MFDWHETNSGNYVTEDDEYITITVFTDKNGAWRGIRDEYITEEGYESAEAAIKAIEQRKAEFVKFRPSQSTTDWRSAKKGGYYRYKSGEILTTKQAKSGKWFVTRNGAMVLNKWFPSFEEASRYADSLAP
jgi:hypothetical protein